MGEGGSVEFVVSQTSLDRFGVHRGVWLRGVLLLCFVLLIKLTPCPLPNREQIQHYPNTTELLRRT
jgi:hypothetical protein